MKNLTICRCCVIEFGIRRCRNTIGRKYSQAGEYVGDVGARKCELAVFRMNRATYSILETRGILVKWENTLVRKGTFGQVLE